VTHDYFLSHGSALARLLSSVDYFLLSKKVEGRSSATLEWLQVSLEDLDHFLRSKGSTLIPEHLTPLHIRAWLAHLQEKGLAKSTINTKYRALSSFVSWCLAEDIIHDSPLKNISPPKVGRPAIPTFKPEHIKALLLLCPPNRLWGARDRAIILTLLHTGIRRGELCSLRLEDVDFNREEIEVRGKGDKARRVYLSPEAQKAILGYRRLRRDNCPMLFGSLDGRPLSGNAVQCLLADLGKMAGITGVRYSAHTFRHTFAVNFLRAAGSLRHLQEILGHASMEPLESYLRTVALAMRIL